MIPIRKQVKANVNMAHASGLADVQSTSSTCARTLSPGVDPSVCIAGVTS
jgi:hypothetical protein